MKLFHRTMPPGMLPFDLPWPWPMFVYLLRSMRILLISGIVLVPLIIVARGNVTLLSMFAGCLLGGLVCAIVAKNLGTSQLIFWLEKVRVARTKALDVMGMADNLNPQDRKSVEDFLEYTAKTEGELVSLLKLLTETQPEVDYSKVQQVRHETIQAESFNFPGMPHFA